MLHELVLDGYGRGAEVVDAGEFLVAGEYSRAERTSLRLVYLMSESSLVTARGFHHGARILGALQPLQLGLHLRSDLLFFFNGMFAVIAFVSFVNDLF